MTATVHPASARGRGEPALASRRRGSLPFVLLSLLVGFLVLYPMGWLFLGSFLSASPFQPGELTLANYARAYEASGIGRAALNTVVFAGGQMLVALAIGTGLAWIVARTNAPGRRFLEFCMLVLLVLPTLVSVVAWTLLLSPGRGLLNQLATTLLPLDSPPFAIYSLGTMIFVQSLATIPFTFLIMAPVFASADASLEESARMSGAGPLRVFLTVTLPMARPALLSTAMLLFILGIESFDVPQLLGAPRGIYTYTSLIFHAVSVREPADYGIASALAMSLQAATLLCVFLYRRSLRSAGRYEGIKGKGYKVGRVELGRWRWLAGTACIGFCLVAVILPLVMVILVSLVPFFTGFNEAYLARAGFDNYGRLLNHPALQGAAWNSLMLAVGGGALCVALAAVIAFLVGRGLRSRSKAVLEGVTMLPLSVPATVLGVGLLWAYITLPIPVYGTMAILAIAYITRYLPLALRTVAGGIAAIGNELVEASRMSGASPGTTVRRIVLPLAKGTLLSAWLMMFMIFFREFPMSILLAGPGNPVLSVVLYDYYQSAETGMLCAASVILTGLVTLTVTAGQRLRRAFA